MANRRVRLAATVASLGLLPALFAVQVRADAGTVGAAPAVRETGTHQAHHATGHHRAYRATVVRTRHGIPHITAHNFGSLGFGSGYAAMGTAGCTLGDVLMTARAQRSRYLGANGTYNDRVSMNGTNLQSDALVTDLHNRSVVEKLLADPLAGPGSQARAMVRGYAAGANKYLRSIGAEVVGQTALSMVRDRATYHPAVLARSVLALRHSPFLQRDVIQRVGTYNKRGFHPDDWDATALLDRWRTELFGEQGTLVDHLR